MDGRSPEVVADRTLLIRGVALLSVGSGLMLVGALLTGTVAVRATRRWVQQWDEPPRAVARRRWGQARSAVSAGAQGWRQDGRPAVPAPSSRQV